MSEQPDELLDAINRRNLRDVKELANPDSIALHHRVTAGENLENLGGLSKPLSNEKAIIDHLDKLKPELKERAEAQLKTQQENAEQRTELKRARPESTPPESHVKKLEQRPIIILTGRHS
jgi:hypothetical protein